MSHGVVSLVMRASSLVNSWLKKHIQTYQSPGTEQLPILKCLELAWVTLASANTASANDPANWLDWERAAMEDGVSKSMQQCVGKSKLRDSGALTSRDDDL